MGQLRAITFDATGTLFYIRGGVGAQYARVAREFGAQAPDALIGQAFGQVWQTLPRPTRDGQPSADDDKGWWHGLVEAVTEKAGLTVTDFDAFFESLYGRFATTEAWGVFPDVEEVLGALRGRYRIGLISDFDRRLRSVLDAYAMTDYFDQILISSEVGADKPDERIFRAAGEQLGCRPEEMLHVGDDPRRDWEGARAMGMQAFELDRERNSLRDLPGFLEGAG